MFITSCQMMLFAAGRPGNTPWLAFGIILLIVLPAISLAIAAVRKEKRRAADLKQTAESLGFEFVAKNNSDYLKSLKSLPLFARLGRRQKILNLMRGKSQSFEVTIFDHNYVVSAGEHSHTRRQSIICFESQVLALPEFTLGPKRFWDKVGNMLGRQTIEFDSHPIFAENYALRGSDPYAVRSVFTDPIVEYFEQNVGYSAEGSANRLLLFKANKRVPPVETAAFLEDGLKALSLIHSGG